jgi:phospholipid/cholesterol/gamma-HCH transport system permease protein
MIKGFLEHLGRFALMLKGSFTKPENGRVYWKEFMEQCNAVGMGALPIILIISVFLGMVMTIQTAYQMVSPLIPKEIISTIVRDSTILELSPTINAIVLAGVVGSRFASELGNMRVSEQIDALEIMGINSKAYLIMPKIIASLLLVPCLIILSISVSILGGYLAGIFSAIVSKEQYLQGLTDDFRGYTIVVAMVKSFVFAFILSAIPSYYGYNVRGGSVEIGLSSTKSVMVSCIFILLADYLITTLML